MGGRTIRQHRHHRRSHSRRGSAGCLVVLVVVVLIGIAATGVLLNLWWRGSATNQWPIVPCTIVESRVVGESGPDDTGPYSLEIRYRYEVDGAAHEGTRWRIDPPGRDDVGELWRIAHRHRPGDRTTCHVDPDDPSSAVLVPGASNLLLLIAIVPASVALVGVIGAVVVLRSGGARRVLGTDGAKSVLRKREGRGADAISGNALLLLFFAFFLGFGGIFPWIFHVRPTMLAREARNWVQVDCVVIASDLRHHRSDDGTTYSADILYEYTIGGETYRANTFDTTAGSTSNHRHWSDVVQRHPAGLATTCLVDPADPYRAVLDSTPPGILSLGAITYIFPLIGAVGLVGTIVAMARSGRGAHATRTSSSSARGRVDPFRSPFDEEVGASTGIEMPACDESPFVLKAGSSRVWGAVAMIGFALVWNGFVWTLLVPEGRRAWTSGDWFMVGFALIFVVVGVVVALASVYSILALFNPTYRLVAPRSFFRLGEEVRIDWERRGRPGSMQRLTVELVGREHATYRRGTKTITDRHEFFVERCLDTTDRRAMAVGTLVLRVPEDAVPSFKSRNNRIEWSLRIRGRIQRWPDVRQEHEITVLGPASPNRRRS